MQALSESINLHPEAAEFPTAVALSTSTTGDPDTFNLDDINKHGGMHSGCPDFFAHVTDTEQ